MPTLIIPIGFSGSGKTTYYKRHCNKNKTIYISKDKLRIKYCNDINDQSQNKRIAIISNKLLVEANENNIYNDNITIYYDNTNIDILPTVKKYLRKYPELKIKIILFMDTFKPRLRIMRIQKDLDNGVIRADTIDRINQNYEDEIKQFKNNLNSIIKYYNILKNNNMIKRLKICKLQNGKLMKFNIYWNNN